MNTGEQMATVVSNKLGASGTGTMFIGLIFSPESAENETIPAYIYITDKTVEQEIPQRQLAALGVDFKTVDLEEFERNKQLLTGRKTLIEIQEETYNGKSRMKVVNIGGGEGRKPTPEQIKKYGAKLKAKAVPAAPQVDEDIPF